MAVQRLPRDPELLTKVPDLRFFLPHRGHGQADLRWRHLKRPPARPPPRSRSGKPSDRALRDDRPLEFCQSGEDPKDELAGRGRGIDRCTPHQ